MRQWFDNMVSWLVLAGFYLTFRIASFFWSKPCPSKHMPS